MKEKVLLVVGPTAVGKSALGIHLAHLLAGEIISGDSQQVYQGLDIGTAKVTEAEMEGVPHHLLNVRALDESFSAHDFIQEATRKIKDIHSRAKLPIIVGGTGLYIQALMEGYHLGGEENHEAMMTLRASLEKLTDEELNQKVDLPVYNRRRAIRALELEYYGTGENKGSDFDFKLIGLSMVREKLYERINIRVEQMLTAGLLEEARHLFDNYPEAQASKGIGYKEFFPYFSGEIDLETAIEKVKQNSRRYAKRQLTWFRNRMLVDFYDIDSPDYPENVIISTRQFIEL